MAPDGASFEAHLARWKEHLGEDFEVVTYSSLRSKPIGPAVRDQFDRALDLGEWSPLKGPGVDGKAEPLPLPAARREALRRNLWAFAVWSRRLGYNHSFAHVCKAMVSLPVSERYAFLLSMALYKRLGLDDYYVKRNGWLEMDVKDVVRDLELFWPSLVATFQAHGCMSHLLKLIEELLTSLLTYGLCGQDKAASKFLPLLDRLILESESLQVHSADRRRALRRLVVCTLGRNRSAFESAGTSTLLLEACDKLPNNMRVDATLLELLDSQIHGEASASVLDALTSFSGMSAGWLVGHQATALLPCGASGFGVVGAAVVAISTLRLGAASGERLIRATVEEFSARTAAEGLLSMDEGSCQGSPVASGALEPEHVDEEAAEDELLVDWFLWGTNPGLEQELIRRIELEIELASQDSFTAPAAPSHSQLRRKRTRRGQHRTPWFDSREWILAWPLGVMTRFGPR